MSQIYLQLQVSLIFRNECGQHYSCACSVNGKRIRFQRSILCKWDTAIRALGDTFLLKVLCGGVPWVWRSVPVRVWTGRSHVAVKCSTRPRSMMGFLRSTCIYFIFGVSAGKIGNNCTIARFLWDLLHSYLVCISLPPAIKNFALLLNLSSAAALEVA